MIPTNILLSILEPLIGKDELRIHSEEAEKQNLPLENYLIDKKIVDEEKIYKSAAEKIGIPYVNLSDKEITPAVLNLLPVQFAETHNIVAFERSPQEIQLAMSDPEDIQTIEFIRRKTGLTPVISLSSPKNIKDGLRKYHAALAEEKFIVQLTGQKTITSEKDLKKAAEEAPIIKIVNGIIEHAVFDSASDIHIEPTEKELTVRYRVDGVLQTVMNVPKSVASAITARIKILANLKIDEHMVPQDGRFKIKLQNEQLSFRVSIIPVYDGEKIVMRVLQEGQKPLTLEELGFLTVPRAIVEKAMDKPHGMILVTGPTGSGKTTTLYSVLGILNTPQVNICTIEDPIEYHVSGINQSQINPKAGFTFASGLRAFLRQDPDIIMVGEIRDAETAEIAIHSAMTGHLVLSTLHTNDAPTTIPRLTDMGIPPFIIAFTANVIIAQRLVRKICVYCKESYILEKEPANEIEKMVDMKRIDNLFNNQTNTANTDEKTDTTTFFRGKGCPKCHNSGYKGRIGIYEVLEVDKELTTLINSRANANEIRKYAVEKGMITILEDGIIKAKQGVTTLEEVFKATRD